MSLSNFDPSFDSYPDYYRKMGLQVVPAHKPDGSKSWKRPKLEKWTELQNELTSQAQYDQWFGQNGQHLSDNLGVICGLASNGLFFLDLDIQKETGALDWYMNLIALHNDGESLKTPTQTTGGGGIQILMRAPLDRIPQTCKTAIGVDVRGQGGFSIVPPSIHESGANYSWTQGLAPWEVEVMEAPEWLLEALESLIQDFGGNKVIQFKTPSPEVAINPFGAIVDGREGYMAKVVWAAVLSLYRDCPILPSTEYMHNAMRSAFQRYEQGVKSRIVEAGTANHILLEREGRGITEFTRKWRYAISQWDTSIAADAAVQRVPKQREAETPKFDPETGEIQPDEFADEPNIYALLNVRQLKDLPDPVWLIDKILLEQSFSLLYAAPGAGKSFVAISIALSIATQQADWFDKPIHRSGPVVYISSEGYADMKFRIMAWAQHHQVQVDDAPFYLLAETVNFMAAGDVMKLIETLKHLEAKAGTPCLIVVDTVSRSLPGADENAQKDMTLFISACDAIRQAMKAAVMGVHHTNKQGGMRGSTVLDGASDLILALERDQESNQGVLLCKKSKQSADGWTMPFELRKTVCGDIAGNESLVAIQSFTPFKTDNGWPQPAIQKAILLAIDEAWKAGTPWSDSPQTRRKGRYIMSLTEKFNIKGDVAEKWIEKQAMDRVIAVETHSAKLKISGYRLLKNPFSDAPQNPRTYPNDD